MNKDNHLITQQNALINASYDLTLNEKRVIYYVLSLLNPKEPTDTFTIHAKDFGEAFDIKPNNAYKILNEATRALFNAKITTHHPEFTTEFHWIDGRKYSENQGYVTLSFTKHVMPYISFLSDEFTKITFGNISELKSVYAMRFYEIFMQYKGIGSREVTVKEMREMFQLQNKYVQAKDFRINVIDKGINEINEKTDLQIFYTAKKTGKVITSYIFDICDKGTKQGKAKALAIQKEITEYRKIPNPPTLKRHPNPDNYSDFEAFLSARYEWALENAKRISKYDQKLREIKLALNDKLKQKKEYYQRIIGNPKHDL